MTKVTPQKDGIKYPRYSNSFSCYLADTGALVADDVPIAQLPGITPQDFARYLDAVAGGKWELSDEDQLGSRGWYEFKNTDECKIVLMVRGNPCPLTNQAPMM